MVRSSEWYQKTKEITKKDNVTKLQKLPPFISQKLLLVVLKKKVTNKKI